MRGSPVAQHGCTILANRSVLISTLSVRALLIAGLFVASPQPQAYAQVADAFTSTSTAPKLPADAMKVPFFVGEKLEYDVKFGSIKVGSGSMEVLDVSNVRGRPSWHTLFRVTGSIPLYKVNDRQESWFDVTTLTSRRFHQDIEEGNYKPKRHYEMFPERGMYQKNDEPEQPTVANPLDEGSLLYFIRTIPLEVGKEYSFSRYFNPEANPVRIKVVRRETIETPAGKFKTIVLQPTFRTKGLFSENGKAEVWVSDDAARIVVQLKSRLSIGSLNLYLKGHNTKAGS